MTIGITALIQCDMTLVMILYMAPMREIGLNWSIVIGFFTFGTRAIKDVLHSFGRLIDS